MNPPQLYNPPIQAIDGVAGTRWSTGATQVGDEWFLVDLGSVAAHLTQIVLDASKSATDFPGAYKVEVSSNGTTYKSVATGAGAIITTVPFTDTAGRYLRITQTGTSKSWWSIQEISITCKAN